MSNPLSSLEEGSNDQRNNLHTSCIFWVVLYTCSIGNNLKSVLMEEILSGFLLGPRTPKIGNEICILKVGVETSNLQFVDSKMDDYNRRYWFL